MYEVIPRGRAGAGRRRFSRCALSLRKGSAKTEFAAWLAIAELHPDAPVRFNGWEKNRAPARGVGVRDPYIPLVATTAEQSDELAFGAMRAIVEHSDLAADFDVGLERIMRIDGHGKAESLANAPGARDGARTTFEVFDETHHMMLPRTKKAHRTMIANLPKRKLADAWALEVTTAPEPGAGVSPRTRWPTRRASPRAGSRLEAVLLPPPGDRGKAQSRDEAGGGSPRSGRLPAPLPPGRTSRRSRTSGRTRAPTGAGSPACGSTCSSTRRTRPSTWRSGGSWRGRATGPSRARRSRSGSMARSSSTRRPRSGPRSRRGSSSCLGSGSVRRTHRRTTRSRPRMWMP